MKVYITNKTGNDEDCFFIGSRASFIYNGDECVITEKGVRIIHAKKVCERWVAHSGNGLPAIIHDNGVVAFFENGVTKRIEDLECDDQMKVCLKLRYTLMDDCHYYHSYDG